MTKKYELLLDKIAELKSIIKDSQEQEQCAKEDFASPEAGFLE